MSGLTTAKKRVVFEMDIPEGFDAVWDEPTGIQAFHDIVICGMLEQGIQVLITKEQESNPQMKSFYAKQLEIMNTLKIVGSVNSEGIFAVYPSLQSQGKKK